jgi:hypothetical protein
VHFSGMPAFPASKPSRKGRSGTIRSAAIELGIHERTLRRWIARPELRGVLRAYRHGKQWRLDIPKTSLALALYKRDVLRAVRPFRRRRKARRSPIVKKTARSLGYDGNRRREQDLRILRAAAQRKISTAKKTSVCKAKSRLAEETQTDRSADYIFETRILAAEYGCDVFDVLMYFGGENQTRENKNLFRRMNQWWPTREQFEKASEDFQTSWTIRTLTEAAYTLAKDNKRIVAKNVAPLLFLNHDREWAWKANEKQRQFRKRTGQSVIFDPYGKQGISLRLFRQRYNRTDIAAARKVAEGMIRSESEKKLDEGGKDASGFGSSTEVMRPNDSRDTQRDKDALSLKDGHGPTVTNDPSVHLAISACEKAIRKASTDAERKALHDYLRKLKSEENFSVALRSKHSPGLGGNAIAISAALT